MFSLRFLFMIFFTPSAMFMGVTKPFVGLLMLIFLYYFRPDVWGVPDWFRPIQFITMAVACGWFLNTRTFKLPPVVILGLISMAMITASAFAPGANQDVALAGASVLSKMVLVMFLTTQLVDTPKKLNQILWINTIGMIWNLKTIIVQGSGGSLDRVNVAVGQGGGANYLAMVLVTQIPFLAIKAQMGDRRERLFALVLLPVYVLCVVLTGSRAGLIALTICAAFIIYRSRHRIVGFGIAALLGLLVVSFLPASQWERFKQGLGTAEDTERDGSAQSRIVLWGAGMRMFQESPLIGKGYGNFQILSPQYAGIAAGKSAEKFDAGKGQRGFVAHSTWVQTLAEGGIVVGVPFFAMLLVAAFGVQRVLRMKLPEPYRRDFHCYVTGVQGMVLAFCITATFGSYIHMDFLWWYMGTAAALPLVARSLHLAAARERAKLSLEPSSDGPGESRRRRLPLPSRA
jgi:O-antigen ligase